MESDSAVISYREFIEAMYCKLLTKYEYGAIDRETLVKDFSRLGLYTEAEVEELLAEEEKEY